MRKKFTTTNLKYSLQNKTCSRVDTCTKLLGLQTDNDLSWKNHIDWLVPKLSGACHAVSVCHMSPALTHSDQFVTLCLFYNEVWSNLLG
jgi:hypothetical protein